MAAEDLEFNPFYQALQTEFEAEYQEALNKCFMLCIPDTVSLEDAKFDKQFVEMHILRPSPFFQGEYMTTDPGNRCSLRLEDNTLITEDGFEEKRRIRILADEIGYNKDNKLYKILVLEGPILLTGVKNEKPAAGVRKKSGVEPLAPKFTFLENKNFLLSLQDSYKMVMYLDEKVSHFNNNYMLLKNYLQDAASRLKKTWTEATMFVEEQCKERFKEDRRFRNNISVAVESYLLGNSYEKLYPVICDGCKEEDLKLVRRFSDLQDVTGEQFSLKKELCCPLPAAVVEVGNLEGSKTPLEKLICMKNTLNCISQGVNAHLLSSLTTDEPPCLTSDDLIPLLITVIVKSKASHLASNLYFVEHFHWASSNKDDLSFSFVTFKAAVSYVQSVDTKQLLSSQSENISSQDSQGTSTEKSSSESTWKSDSGRRKGSRFDRQMDRITKMLDNSTKELAAANAQAPPPVRPQLPRQQNVLRPGEQRPQLGSFLSSLKDDVGHSSWGKQS